MNMDWISGAWIGFVLLVMVTATAVEVSAIRQRVNGANGLILLVASVVCAASSLAVVVINWIRHDWTAALQTAGAALLLGLLSGGLAFLAIQLAIRRSKG